MNLKHGLIGMFMSIVKMEACSNGTVCKCVPLSPNDNMYTPIVLEPVEDSNCRIFTQSRRDFVTICSFHYPMTGLWLITFQRLEPTACQQLLHPIYEYQDQPQDISVDIFKHAFHCRFIYLFVFIKLRNRRTIHSNIAHMVVDIIKRFLLFLRLQMCHRKKICILIQLNSYLSNLNLPITAFLRRTRKDFSNAFNVQIGPVKTLWIEYLR